MTYLLFLVSAASIFILPCWNLLPTFAIHLATALLGGWCVWQTILKAKFANTSQPSSERFDEAQEGVFKFMEKYFYGYKRPLFKTRSMLNANEVISSWVTSVLLGIIALVFFLDPAGSGGVSICEFDSNKRLALLLLEYVFLSTAFAGIFSKLGSAFSR